MRVNKLLDAALSYAAWGWRVVALHTPSESGCSCKKGLNCRSMGKHPRWHEKDLLHGALDGTTDATLIRRWWQRWPDANVGICTGEASGIWVLDVDGEAGEATLADTELPQTVQQVTGSGGRHILFAFTPGLGNEVKFAPGLDVRTEGGLIVAEPSLHPSGAHYAWELSHHPDDVGLAEAPDWLINQVKKGQAPAAKSGTPAGKITEGSRNRRLFEDACAMRRRGFEPPEILAALQIANKARVRPPLELDELEEISQKACRYEPTEDTPKNGTYPHPKEDETSSPSLASFASFAGGSYVEKRPSALEPEAFYGIPGEVTRLLEPHTEAASAGLLVSFLVAAGAYLGRGPHMLVDGSRHGTNLFACLVGPTASGRKGTATGRIDSLLTDVDPVFETINHSGLSTGEGLIHHVRDPRREMTEIKRGGKSTGDYEEKVIDAGAADKRAYIREEEFGAVLKIMTREGNTLSNVIRNAWDNRRLGNLTKNSREVATHAHISIIGHVTEVDLRRYLADEEANNGFANRFLWAAVDRSKILPRGGGQAPLAPMVLKLREILTAGRREEEYHFSEECGLLWDHVYETLSTREPGLLGATTSRAEPQALRMALTYAVLGRARQLEIPHLMGALAVWDFCLASARFVFGDATGDAVADRIEEALRAEGGGLSRTRISDLFKRHARAGDIGRALQLLQDLGRACMEMRSGTSGRPQEVWYAVPFSAREEKMSVLQLARTYLST